VRPAAVREVPPHAHRAAGVRNGGRTDRSFPITTMRTLAASVLDRCDNPAR